MINTLGIDIGAALTDLFLFDEETKLLTTAKVPFTPRDEEKVVFSCNRNIAQFSNTKFSVARRILKGQGNASSFQSVG